MKLELKGKRELELYVDGDWYGTISFAPVEWGENLKVTIDHEGRIELNERVPMG